MKVSSLTFLLLLIQSLGIAQTLPEPATNISFSVDPALTLSSGAFNYRYSIRNSVSSQQDIDQFDIKIDTTAVAINNIRTPFGKWEGGLAPRGAMDWFCFEAEPNPGCIKPGATLAGFSFDSPNLPEISTGFAQGFVGQIPDAGDFVDENTPAPIPFERNVVNVLTVGPGTFTFTTPLSAIDHLIALKHQSVSLGWLRGDEFIKNLDGKLNQAKQALAENKPFEARHKLREFIQKLEEQRKEQFKRQHETSEEGREERKEHSEGDKKFVNDNAFYLLKPNAEFIISKLPAKPSDDDNRDDNVAPEDSQ